MVGLQPYQPLPLRGPSTRLYFAVSPLNTVCKIDVLYASPASSCSQHVIKFGDFFSLKRSYKNGSWTEFIHNKIFIERNKISVSKCDVCERYNREFSPDPFKFNLNYFPSLFRRKAHTPENASLNFLEKNNLMMKNIQHELMVIKPLTLVNKALDWLTQLLTATASSLIAIRFCCLNVRWLCLI